MRVNLGDIYFGGFVFIEYDPNTVILRKLDQVKYDKNNDNINDLNYFVKDYYLTLWKKWGIFLHDIEFSSFVQKPGEYKEIHTPMHLSHYRAIIFCPEEELSGAEFVYGSPDSLEYFTPKFGDICFLKTGCRDYVHGIRTLKSKAPLKYIVLDAATSMKDRPDLVLEEGLVDSISLT
jgi:hypothetical protein